MDTQYLAYLPLLKDIWKHILPQIKPIVEYIVSEGINLLIIEFFPNVQPQINNELNDIITIIGQNRLFGSSKIIIH